MKTLNLTTKYSLVALAIASLMGCSADENQDAITLPDNSPPAVDSNSSTIVTGLAMNGYVANALVWIDLRNNNTPDGFEPIAFTDSQGYVSYNPNTGVNYCETTDEGLQKFCLKTGVQSGELIIKAAQGIELLSGEAFRSVLTASTSVEAANTNIDSLRELGPKPFGDSQLWQAQLDQAQLKLSSFSSLNHYLPTNMSLVDAINALGFSLSSDITDAEVLASDFIVGIQNSNNDMASLFAADVAISRMVDTIALNIDAVSSNLDLGTEGLPISSADAIYSSLAESLDTDSGEQIVNKTKLLPIIGTTSATEDLSDSDIAALINSAVAKFIESVLAQSDVSANLQTRLNALANNVFLQRQVANIPATSISHFQQIDLNNSISDLLALYHTVTLPTLYEPIGSAGANQAAVIAAISDFIRNPNNQISQRLKDAALSNGIDSFTPSFDLINFVNDLLTLANQAENIESIQSLLSGEENDTQVTELANVDTLDDSSFWAGNKISLSGIQDSRSSDNIEQGQVVAFFNGDAQSNAGDLVLCIAYENKNDPLDNISGQLFEGTWSVLGSGEQNRLSLVAEGFNIQMKVIGESFGRDIPDDQQILSLPRMPNELYGQFSFTLNEDSATWHSDDSSVNQSYGVMPTNTIPSTSDECKSVLTLQVN